MTFPRGQIQTSSCFRATFLANFTFLRIYFFSSSKITRLVWVGFVFKYAHFCAISFDAFHTLHFAVLKIAIANVASIHFLFFFDNKFVYSFKLLPIGYFSLSKFNSLSALFFFLKNLSMCVLCINKKI